MPSAADYIISFIARARTAVLGLDWRYFGAHNFLVASLQGKDCCKSDFLSPLDSRGLHKRLHIHLKDTYLAGSRDLAIQAYGRSA